MENKSALLVMDIQGPMVDGPANKLIDKEEYLQTLQQTIDTARKNNIMVIYVVVGFRSNMADFNPSSSRLQGMRKAGVIDALINPKPVLGITEDDTLVVRRRVSALADSDLEVILRSNNINHLVLAGLSTGGVVLSTLRQAADKDYLLTVLSDLCADSDEEVHRVLIEKVFPKHSTVMTSTEWLGALGNAE